MDIKEYLSALDKRMELFGFKDVNMEEEHGADRVFYLRKGGHPVFGLVEKFFFIKYVPDDTSADYVKEFSSKVLLYSKRYNKKPFRLIVPAVFTFPVMVVNKISAELHDLTQTYHSKHFKALEFPCVLDLSMGRLFCYEKIPFLGGAYYRGVSGEVHNLLEPKV